MLLYGNCMLVAKFDTSTNYFKEKELESDSVVKESLTTANDDKKYNTNYYNLNVIISVVYRVN